MICTRAVVKQKRAQVVQAEIEAPEEGATGTSLLWQAKTPVEDFRQSRCLGDQGRRSTCRTVQY